MKLGFLLLVLLITGCDMTGMDITETIPTVYEESGSIEVYFCPYDDCNRELSLFILSAEESVHCAFYELNLPDVISALEEKESIDVKVIVDGDYYDEVSDLRFVKAENKSSYMHDKFCVIDGEKISTGSMNPTENGAFKNNNNLIFIKSEGLAENYENEFNELWNEIYGRKGKTGTSIFYLGDTKIENYFCPEDYCGDKIADVLSNAKESIYFMTFSFTHKSIGNVILVKNSEDVLVKGVFESRGTGSEYSRFGVFSYQDIEVRKDGNPATMHHKVFIVDEKIVITGSFNPSSNADNSNDENILIIYDSEIASEYVKEFENVWENSKI